MCFKDLEKTSDCVPHGILWEGLWEHGLGGPLPKAGAHWTRAGLHFGTIFYKQDQGMDRFRFGPGPHIDDGMALGHSIEESQHPELRLIRLEWWRQCLYCHLLSVFHSFLVVPQAGAPTHIGLLHTHTHTHTPHPHCNPPLRAHF